MTTKPDPMRWLPADPVVAWWAAIVGTEHAPVLTGPVLPMANPHDLRVVLTAFFHLDALARGENVNLYSKEHTTGEWVLIMSHGRSPILCEVLEPTMGSQFATFHIRDITEEEQWAAQHQEPSCE